MSSDIPMKKLIQITKTLYESGDEFNKYDQNYDYYEPYDRYDRDFDHVGFMEYANSTFLDEYTKLNPQDFVLPKVGEANEYFTYAPEFDFDLEKELKPSLIRSGRLADANDAYVPKSLYGIIYANGAIGQIFDTFATKEAIVAGFSAYVNLIESNVVYKEDWIEKHWEDLKSDYRDTF